MGKGKKLTRISGESLERGSPIYDSRSDVSALPKQRPSISITFMDVGKEFGLAYLVEKDKKHRGSRYIMKEFDAFLQKVRKHKSIEDVMDHFKPKKKLNNQDKKSIDKMKQIQDEYSIDTSEMAHIHCCGNGGGALVLHGFVINNCFEIVWIDPDHEIHEL